MDIILEYNDTACVRHVYNQVVCGLQLDDVDVTLSQLTAINPDPSTRQAIEDWFYWLGHGYCF